MTNVRTLSQVDQKSMLATWSKLYKVFACCSSLVVTAEENICCEELCAKMAAALDRDALAVSRRFNVATCFKHPDRPFVLKPALV